MKTMMSLVIQHMIKTMRMSYIIIIMDDTTFRVLEEEIITGCYKLEYWHPIMIRDSESWEYSRPTQEMIRVPGLVHKASTMWIRDG